MADIGAPELADLGQYGSELERWKDSVSMQSVIVVGVALALLFFLRKPIARGVMTLTSKLLKKLQIELSDKTIEKLYGTIEILLVTVGVLVASEILAPPVLGEGFLRRLILSVAVMAVFAAWYQLVDPFLSIFRDHRIADVQMEQDWITRVTRFAILLFGITSVLNVWEVDISGALTGVGVLGAGLAIAAQDLIRNLIAGMTNMSEQRFETGDAVEIEGVTIGTVRRIDLRSTLILGFDQVPRYVPNSDLSNSVVKNYSNMKHRRILVKVPLVMSVSNAQAEAVRDGLREHLTTCGDFDLGEDAPKHVYIDGLSPDAVEIRFYARTTSPDYATYLQVRERLVVRTRDLIDETGTALAYPTQTIQLDRSVDTAGPERLEPPV